MYKRQDINLEYYKIFYYVGKQKSITLAAEELAISQPAVSQAVRHLEEALGSPLFVRTSKGVRLTTEGEVLYSYIKRGYETIRLGEKKFLEMLDLEEGELCIGARDVYKRQVQSGARLLIIAEDIEGEALTTPVSYTHLDVYKRQDHGCEYMTGGRVVVLGKTGKNFAAGMSGGIAYVLDEDSDLYMRTNKEMVSMQEITSKYDVLELKEMIKEMCIRDRFYP